MNLQHSIDVCIIAKHFYPVMTGASERFRRYAPLLADKGVRVRVATIQHADSLENEIVDGIEIRRFPLSDSGQDLAHELLKAAWTWFGENDNYPDVLHLLHHSPKGVPIVWQARLRNIGCLLTYTMMPTISSSFAAKFKSKLYNSYRLSPFDKISAGTRVMGQRLVKLGARTSQIAVIPHGVDVKRFRPVASRKELVDLRLELGFEPDDEIITFVGSILPRKCADLLLEAWPLIVAQRPRARLLLIGAWKERETVAAKNRHWMLTNYSKRIWSLLDESPSRDRINLVGEVDNIEQYLRVSDLFVFPSKQEGMPNALLEAMATGLPCLSTRFIGFSTEDFGDDSNGLFLTDRNSNDIANRTISLLAQPKERARVGKAATSWINQSITLDKAVEQYATLYFRLAKHKPSLRKTIHVASS